MEAQLCLAMISGIVDDDTPVTSAIREIMIHANHECGLSLLLVLCLVDGLPVVGPVIITVFGRLRRKTNTGGGKTRRPGPRNDVLQTCFKRLFFGFCGFPLSSRNQHFKIPILTGMDFTMNQNMSCKVSILLLVSPAGKNSQNIPRPAFREMMIRPFLEGQRPREYKHEL